ncbi:hypothetical protein G9A89_013741 [Geosiphon pyriformis]|nr:hypothetical protein G9A89_013741 [Geosiphon pyriformis]
MSGPSVKRRSARVSSAGSVGEGSTQNVKKFLSNINLLSVDKNLKDSGSVCMDRQFASMNTNGEAFNDNSASDSQMNMPNAKHFNTGAAISSLISSISYNMDDKEEVSLPPRLSFSLKKVWVDPKIVKSQVEVTVKKLFALDINLSAVEEKSATAKTQVIRKLFLTINGFGGATIPSNFEGIIQSTFTSSESMEKATSLARENNIIVNSDLKRQGVCSDRAVVIKKIPIDMPKEMIVTAVSEFGQVVSIQLQLIGLWQKAVVEFAKLSQADQLAAKWSFLIEKNSVHVAKAVRDRGT